ncbi:hypothetical protein Tco_0769753 [Tanacetum coccineum]|uniref:Reverse transcriptase domain-containing protein n=1 Tax=Tanacetum coccineum TaxID=301880 RepID=A0ABQ4ZDS7_9ASTR
MIRRCVHGREALEFSEAMPQRTTPGTSRFGAPRAIISDRGTHFCNDQFARLKIFSGKLKSRWSGPFTIVQVFPYGTVELSQNSGPNFKVNGHRLKHYFGGDIPAMDIPDLQSILRITKIRIGSSFSDPKHDASRERHPMLIQSLSVV